MDVRCNRCATEYDFDDALISERGTTVKCTNCGYQFKVFPQQPQAGTPERWVVKTGTGTELVYTSLRDLQRGIAERQVGPNDLLSRGQQPPRPLGSIAELEPFFNSAPPASIKPQRTLHGVAPAPRTSQGPEASNPDPASSPARGALADSPRARVDTSSVVVDATLSSVSEDAPSAALDSRPTPQGGVLMEAPPTPRAGTPDLVEATAVDENEAAARAGLTPGPGSVTRSNGARSEAKAKSEESAKAPTVSSPQSASSPFAAARREFRSYDEVPISVRREQRSYDEIPQSGRLELRSYDDLSQADILDPGRRARSRWIAAIVILGVSTLLAATVGRRYLLESAGTFSQATTATNEKVGSLVREGNRLMEEGDLEGASEPLVRATALAEKDRSVLAALAHLQTLRADVIWLKLRLLDPSVVDLVQSTHRELGRRVGKARSASDAAFAVAPEDMVVLRARIDTLRLSGDADKAREWIKPIAQNPSDPDNAYVLAALDLADEKPSWAQVVDRLRMAAGGERAPGRAHAALTYALARAGRITEAEAELVKLDSSAGGGLLVDELRSFLKRYTKLADAGAAAPAPATVDPKQLGKLDTSASEEPRGTTAAPRAAGGDDAKASGGPVTDLRKALADAGGALKRGDLAAAERLYERVLGSHPNNTEALSGLADVARRRNNPGEAARLYERVLADNPNYLPALMARADLQWESGNKKAALALYHRVADQAPSSEYGQRAARRIAQAGIVDSAPADEPKPDKEPAPAGDAPASDTPKATPPKADGIDTSDLPGFR